MTSHQRILVSEASVNNLKSVRIAFVQGKFYVLTGPSGSGKSSLAFDVLYAEADKLGLASGLYRVFRQEKPRYKVQGLTSRVVGIEQQILHQTMVESIGWYTGFTREALGARAEVCSCCKGFGYDRDISLDRLVRNPDKPITSGAFTPPVKTLVGLNSTSWNLFCNRTGTVPSTPWRKLPKNIQETILIGGAKEFRGIVTALRKVVEDGLNSLPKRLHRLLGDEIEFYVTNTICSACDAYGFVNVKAGIIDHDETLGSLVRKGLVKLSPKEKQWFRDLNLEGLPVSNPIFNLSTTQARQLRFFTNIRGLDDPALIIFDEPAAGLLPWEARKMASLFRDIRSCGHTVLVMEHSQEIIEAADIVVVFGPGAGADGGKIIFEGSSVEYLKSHFNPMRENPLIKTSSFLVSESTASSKTASTRHYGRSSSKKAPIPPHDVHFLEGYFRHWLNFTDFDVKIPLGKLVCISGPSGSGKTAYLKATFASCDKTPTAWQGRVELAERKGCERIRRPYLITPEAIGKHAGSTPATYIGLWDRIRDFFSQLPEARRFRLNKSYFSFNTEEGRCQRCLGHGFITDNGTRFTECPLCQGSRFKNRATSVSFRSHDIAQINALTVSESLAIFKGHDAITHYLEFLRSTALEYLVLGQPSNSLSGGESQRIKVAAKLCRRLGDRSLYILDNPCRGIGMMNVPRLFAALRELVAKNNTVVIAENNRDVACNCDWLIVFDTPKLKEGRNILNVIYEGPGKSCPTSLWQDKTTIRGSKA